MLRRPGFSLAEIIVAIAVIAILAAVIYPTVAGMAGRARVQSGQESLQTMADGVVAFETDVGTGGVIIGYPASLTQLVVPLVNGDVNICGAAYNGGQRSRWAGPYFHRTIPAAGLPISIGTVADAFGTVVDPSGIDFLTLDVSNVTDEDAAGVDQRVDGGDGAAAGTVRWTPQLLDPTMVTLSWLVPYPDC